MFTQTDLSVLLSLYLQIKKKTKNRGWGFSSVVERLPSKRKALGSVPSSEKKKKKNQKQTKKQNINWSLA